MDETQKKLEDIYHLMREGVDPEGNWEEDGPEDETPDDAVSRIFGPGSEASKEFKAEANRHKFDEHLVQHLFGDLVKKYPKVKLMMDSEEDRMAMFFSLVEDTIDLKLVLRHVQAVFPKAKVGFAPRGDSYIVSDFQHLNPVIVDYTTGYWELECMIFQPDKMPKNKVEALMAEYGKKGQQIVDAIYRELPQEF